MRERYRTNSEGRAGEYARVLEFEYSTEVREFWDQPQPVSMVCAYSNGKKHPGYYMPDMLVLSHGGLKVLEVKPEKKIQKLLQFWARRNSTFAQLQQQLLRLLKGDTPC